MTRTPSFPAIDAAALAGLQKANLEAVVQAQKVLADAARAIAELHRGLVRETARTAPALLGLDAGKRPAAYVADAAAAAEKVATVARQSLELGLKAQGDAARLLAARAAANLDGLKALAA